MKPPLGVISLLVLSVITVVTASWPLYGKRKTHSSPPNHKEFSLHFQDSNVDPVSVILDQNQSIIYRSDGSMFGLIFENDTFFSIENDVKTPVDITDLEALNLTDTHDVLLDPDQSETIYLPDALVPFFPGCFPADTATRTFQIGFVADYSLYRKKGYSVTSTKTYVENIVVSMRLLFLQQFNIVLQIDSLRIITKSDTIQNYPVALPTEICVTNPYTMISAFKSWVFNNPVQGDTSGIYHLLTACWPSVGVVGIAYLSTVCANSGSQVSITTDIGRSTWLISMHEIGHNFGASHTFQNGVGKTGGIMDYGNPYVDGTIQFNPLSKEEMCNKITSSMMSNCQAFDVGESACGDLMINADTEECECSIAGVTSCGKCIDCKLTAEHIQCSPDNSFWVKPSSLKPHSYLPVLVGGQEEPDVECCSKEGRLMDSLTECGFDMKGVCAAGHCVRPCMSYLTEPCSSTEMICGDGCTQPCRYGNTCTCEVRTRSTGTIINWLPDGAICRSTPTTSSTCKAGQCSFPKQTSSPTTPITSSPSIYSTSYEYGVPYEYEDGSNATPSSPPTKRTRRPTRHRRRRTKYPTRRRRRHNN